MIELPELSIDSNSVADAMLKLAKDKTAVVELSTIMASGEHTGEQIEDLIYDHPHYIAYLFDEGCKFSLEAFDLMHRRGVLS